MTYLQFHLVFTLPAIFVLRLAAPRVLSRDALKAGVSLVVIAAIAFLYTTPWDNYLVQRGVWGYGADRVLATWGHVPVEEYLFFVLQPILTGLWLYHLLGRQAGPPMRPLVPLVRWIGVAAWMGLTALGALLLRHEAGLYLGLILVWAGPVLALQWAYGGPVLWRWRRTWAWAVAVPTLYLWVADRIALELGIWHISERYTLGADLFGLPLEEALFFAVTNLLVVQGLMLLLYTWRAAPFRTSARSTR